MTLRSSVWLGDNRYSECDYDTCNGWRNTDHSFSYVQEIAVLYVLRGAGQGIRNSRGQDELSSNCRRWSHRCHIDAAGGVLLISALFVLPNVSAMLYGRSFKQTMMLSMCFAVTATVSGIFISYQFDIAQSGCIVLVAAAIFIGSLVAKGSGMVKTTGILAKRA